jgi:rod shape-determining protein MreC
MVALVTILATLAAVGATGPFEEAAATIFGPVQRGLRQAAEPVANLVENVDDFDRADDENRALRNRIEQLEAENTRLREEQIQVRGREALLAVQEAQSDDIFVTANVITRDLTGLRDIIGLDRGSDDGVEEGMPVVAGGGSLVGVVLEVRPNGSFVRLITDPDSSIRALHQLSRAEGVVQGGTVDSLAVDFVPKATDVQPGHLFVTSGLGGRLPKGIPIGRTTSSEASAQDVFRQIRLRPLAPLDELELVLIQVTFLPRELSLGDDAPVDDATPSGESMP